MKKNQMMFKNGIRENKEAEQKERYNELKERSLP